MKISLITICWNNERDIRETLESVKNQTYNNIEYIVVDGGSKDNTLSIIREYNNIVSKLISEPDKGLYDAINKGIRNATGDVVGMIHAGDQLYDNRVIERIAKTFEENPIIDILYGNSKVVDVHDKTKRVNISPEFKNSLLYKGWMPSHQGIYVKRPLFDKYGLYRLDFGAEGDYEWFIRYFSKDELNIKKLDHYIIRFSLGGVSTSHPFKRLKSSHNERIKNAWKVNGLNPPFGLTYKMFLRKPIQFIRAWFVK